MLFVMATYTLTSGQKITGGAWSALDVATGKVLWQTADPAGASDRSSVSVANGVMYAGSYSGQMYALDAATGGVLRSFASGGSVLSLLFPIPVRFQPTQLRIHH